jgi:hypothetical protein
MKKKVREAVLIQISESYQEEGGALLNNKGITSRSHNNSKFVLT